MHSESTAGLRSIAAALLLVLAPLPVMAEDSPGSTDPGEALREFERRADELSEQAEQTIQDFINLIAPMIERLSGLIDDLPAYHAPEVLPNGDIILRRKRAPMPESPESTGDPATTET